MSPGDFGTYSLRFVIADRDHFADHFPGSVSTSLSFDPRLQLPVMVGPSGSTVNQPFIDLPVMSSSLTRGSFVA